MSSDYGSSSDDEAPDIFRFSDSKKLDLDAPVHLPVEKTDSTAILATVASKLGGKRRLNAAINKTSSSEQVSDKSKSTVPEDESYSDDDDGLVVHNFEDVVLGTVNEKRKSRRPHVRRTSQLVVDDNNDSEHDNDERVMKRRKQQQDDDDDDSLEILTAAEDDVDAATLLASNPELARSAMSLHGLDRSLAYFTVDRLPVDDNTTPKDCGLEQNDIIRLEMRKDTRKSDVQAAEVAVSGGGGSEGVADTRASGERRVHIKVRTKAGFEKKYVVGCNERLEKVMRAFASAVDVPFDEACDKFHFDGLPLRVDGTAAKADIEDDDLIFYTGLTPNANVASAASNNTNSVEQSATTTTTARSEADRGERLRIKVRARDGTEKLYTIRSNDKFEKLMRAFANHVDMPFADAVNRFEFDGQTLKKTQTPSQLELEDEDLITFKN